MSWYNSAWGKRYPILIATDAASGVSDVYIDVPSGWDEFWSDVLATGYDVRVTAANGTTLLTYELEGFNKTTKVCRINIDGIVAGGGYFKLIWLYYSNASATDASSTFAETDDLEGTIDLSDPTAGEYPPLVAMREGVGATQAQQQVPLRTGSSVLLWWSTADILRKAGAPIQGRLHFEEIDYIFNLAADAGSSGAFNAGAITGEFTWCYAATKDDVLYLGTLVDDSLLAAGTYTFRLVVRVIHPDSSVSPIAQDRKYFAYTEVALPTDT